MPLTETLALVEGSYTGSPLHVLLQRSERFPLGELALVDALALRASCLFSGDRDEA